jgi:hypothetical protein
LSVIGGVNWLAVKFCGGICATIQIASLETIRSRGVWNSRLQEAGENATTGSVRMR